MVKSVLNWTQNSSRVGPLVKVVPSLLDNYSLPTPLVGFTASTNGYHGPYFRCDSMRNTYYFNNLWLGVWGLKPWHFIVVCSACCRTFVSVQSGSSHWMDVWRTSSKVSSRLYLHLGWSWTRHKLKWKFVQVKCFTPCQVFFKFKPVVWQRWVWSPHWVEWKKLDVLDVLIMFGPRL